MGNITNLSDARYCSGMGVDMLGFRVIEGQENHLPASTYQEIKGWIAGPKVVAELYGLIDASFLDKILEDYQPDLLEVGADELAYLPKDLSIPIIYAGEADDRLGDFKVEFVIGSTAISKSAFPLLSHCEGESELAAILQNPAIKGIVLKGSPEENPGQQDYDHLADILEALEED